MRIPELNDRSGHQAASFVPASCGDRELLQGCSAHRLLAGHDVGSNPKAGGSIRHPPVRTEPSRGEPDGGRTRSAARHPFARRFAGPNGAAFAVQADNRRGQTRHCRGVRNRTPAGASRLHAAEPRRRRARHPLPAELAAAADDRGPFAGSRCRHVDRGGAGGSGAESPTASLGARAWLRARPVDAGSGRLEFGQLLPASRGGRSARRSGNRLSRGAAQRRPAGRPGCGRKPEWA